MSNNPEKDAIRAEARKREIMDAAFRVFTERSIDKVTMNDVADAAGIGVATVYRHFKTKPDLVLALGARVWRDYMAAHAQTAPQDGSCPASRVYEFFLDSFIDLYLNHRELLRFNQMFNIYVRGEDLSPEQLASYNAVIAALAERFHTVYEQARSDGSLRLETPEKEMFSTTLHLMLAAATRYAVGLVYDGGVPPEKELALLKDMLMERYTVT